MDWRNSNDYEYTKGYTDHQWAWEFLRRNPGYRADWEKELAKGFELRGQATYPIDDPDFVLLMDTGEYLVKWGLYHLVNPDTVAPPYLSSRWLDSLFHLGIYTGSGASMLEGLRGNGAPQQRDIIIGEGQVAIVFNLQMPMEGQLALADNELRRIQRDWLKKSKGTLPSLKVSRDRERLLRYVRVLDAITDNPNVTPSELKTVLLLNSPQHAESTKKSAIKMRDGDYKKLVISRSG